MLTHCPYRDDIYYTASVLYFREAWNLCGDMAKEEAMKMYIKELEQVRECKH